MKQEIISELEKHQLEKLVAGSKSIDELDLEKLAKGIREVLDEDVWL